MQNRIDIYIGSDNSSRRISKSYLKKIQDWASALFPEGYTLFKGRGYYNGESEESVIINVFCEQALCLKHHLERLKRELKQEAILLVKSSVETEVL